MPPDNPSPLLGHSVSVEKWRQDTEKLIAEVRRLDAEVERLRAEMRSAAHDLRRWHDPQDGPTPAEIAARLEDRAS